MVYFPVRKCYHAAKITFLIVLVVTVFALFEQWRGGKRNASAMYSDPLEAEYERQILEDEARIIPGLGEDGVAATLIGDEKKLGEESEKKLAINVYLSDRIPYNRTLKDYRNPACQRVVYDAELPSTSVIIIFHNEPYSVVVRTIWSVINSAKRSNPWFKHANFVDQQTGRLTNMGYPGQEPNSPYVYLKEIILVDDNSTLLELKGKLSHYIRTRLPPDLIRILRLPDRIGLTRARLAGARYAAGDVLIFLDSHCEGQPDWLRPLLSAIKHRPHAVVVPIIDVIETSNFYYSVGDISTFQVGGFTFMGHFTWTDVPEREKKRRGSDIGPTWSPTMAGGLFAISRDYFWELGAYDEQMAGWGGENLEMSFRIWQCGGTLETIPCSRVGHVFRSFHPYGMPASTDTHGINTARMAEVWMDEYAELFYLHRPDLRNNPLIGDVTHRRVLREKLNCKSFQWYLDNIYKEKFVPVRDVYGYGRFKNEATQLCLDTLQLDGDKVPLGAYPCYPRLQATQYFSLSNKGELRDEVNCASVQQTRRSEDNGKPASRPVVMSTCHGKSREQRWARLPSGQLQHVATSLCLTAPRKVNDVVATVCNPDIVTQLWKIDYSEENDFKFNSEEDNAISEERDRRISKLRGPRSNRRSRSLLSYDNNNDIDETSVHNSTTRRHLHKVKRRRKHGHKSKHNPKTKKHVKNKFIIRIERTMFNGTEDHLEMDIHCKHRQLYPNNTFVRDLVTILNDKNIKVINNGRVFERNKVSELRSSSKHKRILNKLDIEGAGQPPAARSPHQPPSHAGVPPLAHLTSNTYKKPMTVPEVVKPASQPIQGAGFGDSIIAPIGNAAGMGGEGEKKGKLIIEDFVEIKTDQTTEAGVRLKHKHKSRESSPSPRASHRAHRSRKKHKRVSTTLKPNKESSDVVRANSADIDIIDSPLLDESRDRLESRPTQDEWHVDEGSFRSHDKKSKQPTVGSGESDSPTRQDEVVVAVHPPAIGDLLSDTVEVRTDPETAEKEHSYNEIEKKHNRDLERRPVDTDVYFHKDQLTAFEPRYSRSHRRNASTQNSDAARRSEEAAPIKLVMNTNLTFNVDDDFFNWKNRDTEDIVKEFVSELSIPTNETEISFKYVDTPHEGGRDKYLSNGDVNAVNSDSEVWTSRDTVTTASDLQQHTRTPQPDTSSSSESSGE